MIRYPEELEALLERERENGEHISENTNLKDIHSVYFHNIPIQIPNQTKQTDNQGEVNTLWAIWWTTFRPTRPVLRLPLL